MGYEVISAKMLILGVSVSAIKNLGALNLSFRRVCVWPRNCRTLRAH